MKKLLLLEDKPGRQKDALLNNCVTLDRYEGNYLDNMINNEDSNCFDQTIEAIENGDFDFSKYHTVAVHGSFTKNHYKVGDRIRNICVNKKINLVYFSGGDDDSNGEHVISLKDETFYSNNLILFLDQYSKGTSNLGMLKYGKSWDLNRYYDLLKELKKVIDDESGYDTDDDIPYLSLGDDLSIVIKSFEPKIESKIENGWLPVSEAVALYIKVEDYIEDIEDE